MGTVLISGMLILFDIDTCSVAMAKKNMVREETKQAFWIKVLNSM